MPAQGLKEGRFIALNVPGNSGLSLEQRYFLGIITIEEQSNVQLQHQSIYQAQVIQGFQSKARPYFQPLNHTTNRAGRQDSKHLRAYSARRNVFGCLQRMSADLSSSPNILQSCRTGPSTGGSNLSHSHDSQELCSYGGRTPSFVGTVCTLRKQQCLPWAAEFLGGSRQPPRLEGCCPGGRRWGKERDSFTENCFTDCFGQLPRLLYRPLLPKRHGQLSGFQKRRGQCGERKKRGAVSYTPIPNQGGCICPCCDSTNISGVKSQTHDVQGASKNC